MGHALQESEEWHDKWKPRTVLGSYTGHGRMVMMTAHICKGFFGCKVLCYPSSLLNLKTI